MKKPLYIICIITFLFVFAISGIAICQEKKIWGKEKRAAHKLLGELQLVYQQVIELIDKALSEELGDPDELNSFKELLFKEYNPELMPENLADLENFGFRMLREINNHYLYWKDEEYVDETILENLKEISGLISNPVSDQIPNPKLSVPPDAWNGTWEVYLTKNPKETETIKIWLETNIDKITGTFSINNGKIIGTCSENILTGTWEQNNDRSTLRFSLSSDGKSFSGELRNNIVYNCYGRKISDKIIY